MKNSRKEKISETVETVRERERERELYSNEISFINYAKKLNNKINNIKADCMSKKAYDLSFLRTKMKV